jgi:hypothetical protein
MQAFVWKRIDAPTLTLSLVAVALLVAYRIAMGAGFGFVDDPTSDEPVNGFLANPSANLTYAAWATQTASGRWLFALGRHPNPANDRQ